MTGACLRPGDISAFNLPVSGRGACLSSPLKFDFRPRVCEEYIFREYEVRCNKVTPCQFIINKMLCIMEAKIDPCLFIHFAGGKHNIFKLTKHEVGERP